jgi:transcription termination/antitermination protein NusA
MKVQQKLDMKDLGIINTFEKITKVLPIEFLENKGQLVFIVKEDTAKKAIGKGGEKIKRLSRLLQKRVKIIELSKNPQTFVERLIYPIKLEIIEQYEDTIMLRPTSIEDKARLIGRNSTNIKFMNSLLEKHYKLRARIV